MDSTESKMDISILFCSKNDPGLDFVQEGDTREAIRNEYGGNGN
jgi:hypothetical protein